MDGKVSIWRLLGMAAFYLIITAVGIFAWWAFWQAVQSW